MSSWKVLSCNLFSDLEEESKDDPAVPFSLKKREVEKDEEKSSEKRSAMFHQDEH